MEADILFGSANDEKISKQSYVIFDESIADNLSDIEFRDGVTIQATDRTAMDGQKFDYEIISKGTVFLSTLNFLYQLCQKIMI